MTQISGEKFEDMRKIMANSEPRGEVCELNYKDKHVLLYGDTFIKFKHQGTFTSSKMFRMAFNSNYEKNAEIVFDRYMLDPDTVAKDTSTFPENFRVKLIMKDVEPEIADREEISQQKAGFELILKTLAQHQTENLSVLDTQTLVFGDPDFDDRDEMMVVNFEVAGQIACCVSCG